MGGSSIQLFAIGPQDFHLTANPQITFFKSVFRRHTNFATDIRRIHFNGDDPKLGSVDAIAKVNKDGELLADVFLEASVTGTSQNEVAYTVNHFGNSMIKKCEVLIGGYIIDTLYPQWLQIYKELNDANKHNLQTSSGLNGGKYTSLNFTTDLDHSEINMNDRIVGDCPLVFGGSRKNNTITKPVGEYKKKIYIPLPFWFTKSPGMYLPLEALYQHNVELRFSFENDYKLKGNSNNISSLVVDFKLYGKFIHLDEHEKKRFAQSNHEYLIEQVQLNNNGLVKTSNVVNSDITTELAEVDYELSFSHPIKYFTFSVVNEGSVSSTLSANSGMGPCYFVSLCSNDVYGNDGNDGEVELLFDGVERERRLPMIYYTRMLPKKYCKNVLELDRIGMYSFALNPLDNEPSGTCNFSKIFNKNLKLKLANRDVNNIKSKDLYIFGVNYNVLVITNGMGALRYR